MVEWPVWCTDRCGGWETPVGGWVGGVVASVVLGPVRWAGDPGWWMGGWCSEPVWCRDRCGGRETPVGGWVGGVVSQCSAGTGAVGGRPRGTAARSGLVSRSVGVETPHRVKVPKTTLLGVRLNSQFLGQSTLSTAKKCSLVYPKQVL